MYLRKWIFSEKLPVKRTRSYFSALSCTLTEPKKMKLEVGPFDWLKPRCSTLWGGVQRVKIWYQIPVIKRICIWYHFLIFEFWFSKSGRNLVLGHFGPIWAIFRYPKYRNFFSGIIFSSITFSQQKKNPIFWVPKNGSI